MWNEKFTNKDGQEQYRFYEKYKDPLTEKWRRVSVVMNKDTKPSQREAKKQLDAKIKDKINDKTPITLKTLTFHQACDEWFNNYKIVSGSKQTTITTKYHKVMLIKRNCPNNILVKNMYLQAFQDIIDSIISEKSDISYQSLNDAKSLLKTIMKFIQKRYAISDIAYLEDITIPRKAKTIEEVKAKRENYLEMNEVQLIISQLQKMAKQKKTPHIRRSLAVTACIVEFLALNGMRIGELLALRPENIDFQNKKLLIDGTIHFIDAPDGFGVKDTTKTEASYRTISLTSRSIEILKQLLLENKKCTQWDERYKDRGFIFTNLKGNPLAVTSINRNIMLALDEIKDENGNKIINKRVTTHTFRHSHISLLSQLGIALKAIMERVGHSDHKTTLQIYSHVTEKMDKDMMEKLEAVNNY